MDALFIIPALISPSVPDRLVPGLAKMIERNIVLTYSSTIRIAALRKFANMFKYNTSESDTSVLEGDGKTGGLVDVSIDIEKGKPKGSLNLNFAAAGSGGSLEISKMEKLRTMKADDIEVPKGISFYNAVSLEPTIMEIPIMQKKGFTGLAGEGERIIRIGFKCVPYKLDGVSEIKKYLANSRNMALTQSYFDRKLESIKKRIWMTMNREIYRGLETTGDILKDVVLGPSSEDLSDPNILMNLMNMRSSSRWSSIIMFTTFDFEDQELKELLDQYRRLVKTGWGDIVIINENRESINFCTTKMLACYDYPYTYLREILKMGNVIDYREIKGYTRPFSMVSLRGAFKECAVEAVKDFDTKKLLEDKKDEDDNKKKNKKKILKTAAIGGVIGGVVGGGLSIADQLATKKAKQSAEDVLLKSMHTNPVVAEFILKKMASRAR